MTKIMKRIQNRMLHWLGTPEDRLFKSGLFPTVTSFAYSRLTLQDKILIIGKLISQLRSTNNPQVKLAERILITLNRKLDRQIIKMWNES